MRDWIVFIFKKVVWVQLIIQILSIHFSYLNLKCINLQNECLKTKDTKECIIENRENRTNIFHKLRIWEEEESQWIKNLGLWFKKIFHALLCLGQKELIFYIFVHGEVKSLVFCNKIFFLYINLLNILCLKVYHIILSSYRNIVMSIFRISFRKIFIWCSLIEWSQYH